MILVPNPTMLDAFPTDPHNGGPYVMWQGTPYAHVMVPLGPAYQATWDASPEALRVAVETGRMPEFEDESQPR